MAIVCYHEEQYFLWGNHTDIPLTYMCSKEQLIAFLKNMKPTQLYINEKIELAEEKGVSSMHYDSLEDLLEYNQAGPKRKKIPFDEVIKLVSNPPDTDDITFYD